MGRSDLGIVIPAYNEERTIGSVVRAVLSYGHGCPIVVNDASRDRTAEIARLAGADVVSHEQNRGYDAAIESGFRRALELGCSYVVTMDADGQHDPSLVAEYLARLRAGTDLVLGIRDRYQRFGEYLFACVTRLLFGVHDPLCGMKGYRLSIYRELGHFDSFGSIGTELALYAVRNKRSFVQIPVRTRCRQDAPRFGWMLTANYRLLRAMVIGLVRTGPKRRS